jgi:hypothetical protein
LRHHAEPLAEHREIEPREVEDLQLRGIAEQPLQVRGRTDVAPDLHHIGRAVAGRELHHAEPVAMRIEPHRLGVDRDRAAVARQVGQIAAVQADGHGCSVALAPGAFNQGIVAFPAAMATGAAAWRGQPARVLAHAQACVFESV